MSMSKANELLQSLVDKLNKRWNGQGCDDFTATKAYEICRQIVEEADKGED